MMHLQDLASFRATLNPRGTDDNIFYIQTYTTEKTMAYQLHHGLFTNKDTKQLFSTATLSHLANSIDQMSTIIYDCTGDNIEAVQDHCTQDGCA
jgi:hypothetical protein